MAIFYHVDRGRQLHMGQVLGFHSFGLAPGPQHSTRFREQFSRLTMFGARHMGPAQHFEVEHFYEAIRSGHFPDRPSRFQSIFGSKTMAEAESFMAKYPGGPNTLHPYWVWRVEAESWIELDMSLMHGSLSLYSYDQAMDYWSGRQSATPVPEILMQPPVAVLGRVAEWSPAPQAGPK